MPLTSEQKKEYDKKYYEEHKKKKLEYCKKYNEEHKKKRQEYSKKYYEEHKQEILEKGKEYGKEYRTTETAIKNKRINRWKYTGIISDDFDELYDKYINATECELCNTPITEGGGITGKKHLDHDHKTGKFRNILCGHCNTQIMRFK